MRTLRLKSRLPTGPVVSRRTEQSEYTTRLWLTRSFEPGLRLDLASAIRFLVQLTNYPKSCPRRLLDSVSIMEILDLRCSFLNGNPNQQAMTFLTHILALLRGCLSACPICREFDSSTSKSTLPISNYRHTKISKLLQTCQIKLSRSLSLLAEPLSGCIFGA